MPWSLANLSNLQTIHLLTFVISRHMLNFLDRLLETLPVDNKIYQIYIHEVIIHVLPLDPNPPMTWDIFLETLNAILSQKRFAALHSVKIYVLGDKELQAEIDQRNSRGNQDNYTRYKIIFAGLVHVKTQTRSLIMSWNRSQLLHNDE
jgi:hypothetical protein